MSGFKGFLMRGNLLDLAVAVVIGIAFNAIVQAIVSGMITPLIGIFTHHVGNFATLSFSVSARASSSSVPSSSRFSSQAGTSAGIRLCTTLPRMDSRCTAMVCANAAGD